MRATRSFRTARTAGAGLCSRGLETCRLLASGEAQRAGTSSAELNQWCRCEAAKLVVVAIVVVIIVVVVETRRHRRHRRDSCVNVGSRTECPLSLPASVLLACSSSFFSSPFSSSYFCSSLSREQSLCLRLLSSGPPFTPSLLLRIRPPTRYTTRTGSTMTPSGRTRPTPSSSQSHSLLLERILLSLLLLLLLPLLAILLLVLLLLRILLLRFRLLLPLLFL